jgi:alpha-N-acetylglucosamine transferase
VKGHGVRSWEVIATVFFSDFWYNNSMHGVWDCTLLSFFPLSFGLCFLKLRFTISAKRYADETCRFFTATSTCTLDCFRPSFSCQQQATCENSACPCFSWIPGGNQHNISSHNDPFFSNPFYEKFQIFCKFLLGQETMSKISASSPKVLGLLAILFTLSCLMTLSLRSNHPLHSYRSRFDQKPYLDKNNHNKDQQQPNVAFVTFLGAFTGAIDHDKPEDDNDDGYYVSTRVLGYQLMHSTTAGTNASIPFVVVVTDEVSARKRARLEKDGATIIQVSRINPGWAIPGDPRWKDMMTKLRLFELTQFSKICYIDSDHLVTDRLDGIFSDEATLTQHTLSNPAETAADEAELPRTYMMAAHVDYWGYDHEYPPSPQGEYMNFGFAVFSPSTPLFDYYVSVLGQQGRFDMGMQEQSLINYAHRRGGNMPWKPLWPGWNVNWATEKDWKAGAKSFHAKYWDSDPSHDKVLKAMWREQRAEMEGFYRGRDGT